MAHSTYASNRYRTVLNVPLINTKAIIQDKEIYINTLIKISK